MLSPYKLFAPFGRFDPWWAANTVYVASLTLRPNAHSVRTSYTLETLYDIHFLSLCVKVRVEDNEQNKIFDFLGGNLTDFTLIQ